jgi:hypothetical protein
MSASSSVGQRFSQLIQALGMSKNAFAISLDKTATVIQHLVDERNKPGFDLMNKVVDVYPNVSIEWLLRGKGPMMLGSALGAATPVAPAAPKAVPVTPSFPSPLFAVSAAGPPTPKVSPVAPTAPPATVVQEALPVASEVAVRPAPEPIVVAPPVLQSIPSAAPESAASLAANASAPAALDAATLTAALHAQHLQHQLALAEQRNQHLQEQQRLILERQALMQQMLDLMRRPV